MIAKPYRFHGYNALRFVYGRGQTVRGPQLAVKYAPNRRSSYRAAVVVSRKVHKSAVVRNRIRRRIYEVMRLNQSHITGSFDIVITVFSEQLAALSAQELQLAVTSQLVRAGIVEVKE